MSAEPGVTTVPLLWPRQGLTVADLDALPDCIGTRGELVDGVRYELVDGVLKGLTAPTVAHQEVLLELHLAVRSTAPPGFRTVQAVGVELDEDQRAVPDLTVIRTSNRTLPTVPVV